MAVLLLAVDRAVVLCSALVVALFAACVHASDVQHGAKPLGPAFDSPVEEFLMPDDGTMRVSDSLQRAEAAMILEQVTFPKPPMALIEIDHLGNILIPAVADAVVTHDGVGDPAITGENIDGTRCARSVASALSRTDGPVTIVCLPREYGLYERMNGRPAPGGGESP